MNTTLRRLFEANAGFGIEDLKHSATNPDEYEKTETQGQWLGWKKHAAYLDKQEAAIVADDAAKEWLNSQI
jgi:hypothetical protein